VLSSTGPSHQPHFIVQVTLFNEQSYTGAGRSKKEAEQAAAHAALTSVHEVPAPAGEPPVS